MNNILVRKLKRNVFLDYVSTFITNLNMQSSIWVLYLAYCGMNLAEIGILEGVYHITSIIFEIPSGAVADLIGRKKSMIVSRFCVAVSCLIMMLYHNFWLFALSFSIQALGNNFNSGSEEALIYDSMKAVGDEQKYIGVNGRLNVIIEISQGIATVAGGVLAEYSFMWCYLASFIIAVLSFAPVIFMTEAPVESGDNAKEGVLKMFKNHFVTSAAILKKDRRILGIILFFATVFSAQTLMFYYSQQYFYDLGYNKIYISIFMLVVSGFSCAGALLSEKIYGKFGNKVAVIASLIIGFSIIGYVFNVVWASVLLLSVASFCNSSLYPIQSASLNALIPSEQRATLISVSSMFFSVVMILLFPVAGFLADIYGITNVFVGIGSLIILFTLYWKARKRI